MPNKPSSGFTLIEMTLVAALMASVIAIEAERRLLQSRELRRDLLIQQIERIELAIRDYRKDRRQAAVPGENLGPTSMADLLKAPHNDENYLGQNKSDLSAFGTSFSLQPSGDKWLLQVETGSDAEAEMLANRLQARDGSAQNSLLFASLTATGGITNEERYYLRDGERPLTGDLDAGRQSLKNIFELHTQDLMVEGTQAILSDPGAKQRIQPLSSEHGTLASIRPLRYSKGGRTELGFSAAEVAKFYPELVHRVSSNQNEEPQLYLSYHGLLAVLWAEVHSLRSQLEALKSADP